jgi:hypothetical protein
MRRLAPIIVLAILCSSSVAAECVGVQRWAVKVASDAAAWGVNVDTLDTTVEQLVSCVSHVVTRSSGYGVNGKGTIACRHLNDTPH